jgi:hypothetical protein
MATRVDLPSEYSDAAIAAQLALGFPSWVHRRVEHVSYLDRTLVRWESGVMFRWPEEDYFNEDSRPARGQVVYVPLDLVTKGGLIGLDGMRPDDSRLPLLTSEQSARLAYLGIAAVIWGTAKTQHQAGLKDETLELLRVIASAPRGRATNLLDLALKDPQNELSRVLLAHDTIRAYLTELAYYILLLAPAVYEPGKEVVYRYTYCKVVDGEKWRKAFWDRLRFKDLELQHQHLSFGWCRSFHFEVEAPPEIRIPRALMLGTYDREPVHLRVTQPVAEADGRNVIDMHARRPTEEAFKEHAAAKLRSRPPLFPAWPTGKDATTACYYTAADGAKATKVRRSDRGHATVWFRLDSAGTFLAATAVSCVTLSLLIAAILRLSKLEGQTGVALLLALPIVMLGLLTRQGEHSFATRLLRLIRGAALIVAICALIMAWILAGGFIHHPAGAAPPFACKAGLTDTDVHPAPHHTWKSTADLDTAAMSCTPGKDTEGDTHVGEAAKITALTATIVAGLMTAWLLTGWLVTLRRSRMSPLIPEPSVPDDLGLGPQ